MEESIHGHQLPVRKLDLYLLGLIETIQYETGRIHSLLRLLDGVVLCLCWTKTWSSKIVSTVVPTFRKVGSQVMWFILIKNNVSCVI